MLSERLWAAAQMPDTNAQHKVVVLLQARTGSTRLPGKSLICLGSRPVAVVAALRAGNTGLPVVAAIPDSAFDDALAQSLQGHGIATSRGSETDVLGRIAQAAAGLSDEAIAVRLTADNICPDGSLIEAMVQEFIRQDCKYLRTCSAVLPYGMSAEVFRISALREAAVNASTAAEREHVTPYIIKKYGDRQFAPATRPGPYGHLRCTIDTPEDLRRIMELVQIIGHDRLLDCGWQELCLALAALPGAPRCRTPRQVPGNWLSPSRYALGTAQLGMAYGITNSQGMLTDQQAADLLETAIAHGIDVLDTAEAYGLAERRIGALLSEAVRSGIRIHTKLDPAIGADSSLTASELEARTEVAVLRSLRELRVSRLDVLMLHRWADRRKSNGAIWKRLKALQQDGLIGKLGASVSSTEEALNALDDPDVAYIQLPFNVLDWRWQAAGVPSAALRRADVTIEARSVLLQGLLGGDPAQWPRIPQVDPEAICRDLDGFVERFNRQSRADLCYSYVASQPWVHSVVVGMLSAQQVRENASLFCAAPLTLEEAAELAGAFKHTSEDLLNPAKWPK